jgi:hypothetical protein
MPGRLDRNVGAALPGVFRITEFCDDGLMPLFCPTSQTSFGVILVSASLTR